MINQFDQIVVGYIGLKDKGAKEQIIFQSPHQSQEAY
jgi:hypothetical protein